MATAIGIMDREGWNHRTDILVVVNPDAREVLWVPRDLHFKSLDNRINIAFKRGGHALLQSALHEYDIPAENSICVLRSVVEKAFANYRITVPVAEPQAFYYPLTPQQPIEDGQKIVRFEPPSELLTGERFHQWLGARIPLEGGYDASSDLVRISRQQVLLRRLLEEHFDFGSLSQAGMDISSPTALEEVALVSPDWHLHTLPDLVPVTLRRMHLLIRKDDSTAWGQPHAGFQPVRSS